MQVSSCNMLSMRYVFNNQFLNIIGIVVVSIFNKSILNTFKLLINLFECRRLIPLRSVIPLGGGFKRQKSLSLSLTGFFVFCRSQNYTSLRFDTSENKKARFRMTEQGFFDVWRRVRDSPHLHTILNISLIKLILIKR